MLAGVYRVRRPARVYGMLDLFLRVVVSANEFEFINDLDWMQHFPDMVPELGEISQESGDEIRITKVGDMCKLLHCRRTLYGKSHSNGVINCYSEPCLVLLQLPPNPPKMLKAF
jgi:hypothetical protein